MDASPTTHSSPVVLELIGPSGVGKSSIVRAMREMGGRVYYPARPRTMVGWAPLLRNAIRGAIRFAPQFTRAPSRPWYRLGILVQLLAYSEMLQSWHGRGGVAVLDQGPVYLLSILQRALRGDGSDSRRFVRQWEEMLDAWSRELHLLVVLDASDELLFERLQLRGTPHPLLGKPPSAASRTFAASRRSRAAVIDALVRRNPALRVLPLPVDDRSPAFLARTIREQVDLLLARRRAGQTGDGSAASGPEGSAE